jgi:hypothetical protein
MLTILMSASVLYGGFMIGKAKITHFLAWLRNRFDEFLSADEAPETGPRPEIKQTPTQVTQTPIWDAWSWPEPRAKKKVLPEPAPKRKSRGPMLPRVAAQGAACTHAGFAKAGR